VLWICDILDILVQIRIWGYVPLFSLVADKMPTINKFYFKLLTYYFLKLHLNQSKKIKVKKKSQNIFLVDGSGRDPDPYKLLGIWTQIREAQKHTDPDPQHCYKHLPIALVGDVNLLVRLVNDLR
jgi:hypothetical protein